MPQVFQVLRCYKCFVFQVHQTKKSNKWACKLCGEKQSIKRHYGLGTGQECRQHVQKLNSLRGEIEELRSSCSITEDEDSDNNCEQSTINVIEKNSRWAEYTENKEPEPVSEETEYIDGNEVVLEIPKHQSRKRYSKHNFRSPEKIVRQINGTIKLPEEPTVNMMYLDNEDILCEKSLDHSQDYFSNTTFVSQNKMPNILKCKTDIYRNVLVNEVAKENWPEYSVSEYSPNFGLSEEYTDSNLKDNNSSTSFENVNVKGNSKWAQYVNDEENHHNEFDRKKEIKFNYNRSQQIEELQMQNEQEKRVNNLFSLCDEEEDLDSILNI